MHPPKKKAALFWATTSRSELREPSRPHMLLSDKISRYRVARHKGLDRARRDWADPEQKFVASGSRILETFKYEDAE